MKKIVVLTGDETRHTYFRKKLALNKQFQVLATFCEGAEQSLHTRTFENETSSKLEKRHALARAQAELDFFGEAIFLFEDRSNPIKIKKGEINSSQVVNRILELNPDLLVCYGSSLIKTELLDVFKGRFLNVHLGLSPYYRGCATNIWPMINKELHMVGATFMHIDRGIDTGRIIHQVRADYFLGDSPHSIGNRLIVKMTDVYASILAKFESLVQEKQPQAEGVLYKRKDFDTAACEKLYQNFRDGLIESYLEKSQTLELPYIVSNRGQTGAS